MKNLTIGYLSWKRHNILEQTLNSHKENGLFDIIPSENRFIHFQEICDLDISIANKFDCNYIGSSENLGILNAFIKMIEHCKTEYFIFCENDWYLIENKDITIKILEDSIQLLENNVSDIIKLRHRKYHGHPLHSKPGDVNGWLNSDCSGFPYKLESLSWLDEPNVIYDNILEEYDGNYKWYITNLDHQHWSNNIFMCKTNHLKENMLPLLEYFIDANNKYSGLEDILINYKNFIGKDALLDDSINKYSKIKIAGGEGLFTHKDK
jgi:hypothetical protein